ncbi:unnamed protein product [Anisakis simplex]|uniref:Tyrosine-protein phosphatase domain-containing protein n=1 Tax=Anisakis simplex TaxID=6269 RepID=A0A158PPL7_ANISI|nr:unnamed protein product [Anisakis simplex]
MAAGEDEEEVARDNSAADDGMDDPKLQTMTPKEFIDTIAKEGEQVSDISEISNSYSMSAFAKCLWTYFQLIIKWHKMIIKNPPKVDAFLDPANTAKNRFPNILLYDRSRVKLKDNLGGDYYHASFVDSYDKIDGYILAQAPFDDDTESDFWRMIYQERPKLIVILSTLDAPDGRKLMRSFWPRAVREERPSANGYLMVRNNSIDEVCIMRAIDLRWKPSQWQACKKGKICYSFGSHQPSDHLALEENSDAYNILVMGPFQRGKSGHRATLIHYKKWIEDKVIPDSLLEFRATVKLEATRAMKDGREGAICLVCPSGVHRCGTFAVLDIILDRLANERKVYSIDDDDDIFVQNSLSEQFQVGLLETVTIVRKQRYGCLTHFAHYNHIADLVTRQAISSGVVDASCIGTRKK